MGEGLLPEIKREGLQMWPLGQGIVVTTVAVSGGNGMFIMAGVPDPLQGVPGQMMDGDPLTTLRALIDLPGNQSSVLVYPSTEAVDATIASLTDLKRMMSEATQ